MADEPLAGPAPAPYPVWGQIRLIRTVFVAAVSLLAAVASFTYYSTTQNAENARWVDHTYQVTIEADQVFSDLRGATATARGYVMTGDSGLLELYRQYSAAILPRIDALRPLVSDNPPQVARVDRLRPLAAQELAVLAQMVAATLLLGVPASDEHRRR